MLCCRNLSGGSQVSTKLGDPQEFQIREVMTGDSLGLLFLLIPTIHQQANNLQVLKTEWVSEQETETERERQRVFHFSSCTSAWKSKEGGKESLTEVKEGGRRSTILKMELSYTHPPSREVMEKETSGKKLPNSYSTLSHLNQVKEAPSKSDSHEK